MGTDTLSGRPEFCAVGAPQSPVGWSRLAAAPRYGDRHDVGYSRYGDRHDVRRTDQERSTSNVQLSTFNVVTERAHGGRDMGTDTELRRHLSLVFGCLYCGVAICSVSVFSVGLRRKVFAGGGVAADISQPGGAEPSDQRGQAPRLWASGKFGCGCAALSGSWLKSSCNVRERKGHETIARAGHGTLDPKDIFLPQIVVLREFAPGVFRGAQAGSNCGILRSAPFCRADWWATIPGTV